MTLLGNESEIRQTSSALGLNLDDASIVAPMRSEWLDEFISTYFELRQHKGITRDCAQDVMRDVSYFGTVMVYKDKADGIVSGALH